MSKTKALQDRIDLLEKDLLATQQNREAILQIANYTINQAFTIEQLITTSVFKGNIKRPLRFFILNYKQIIYLIETITKILKDLRIKLNTINDTRADNDTGVSNNNGEQGTSQPDSITNTQAV